MTVMMLILLFDRDMLLSHISMLFIMSVMQLLSSEQLEPILCSVFAWRDLNFKQWRV